MKIEDEIKGRFRNEYHKGLINLMYTVKQVSYQFLQILKNHSITEPQYNILRVLRGAKPLHQVSINYLKERMLDKRSDVSRIIDRLLKKGYIRRKENIKDRRQKDISITAKGLNLLNEMYGSELKSDELLNNLTVDETRELNKLLDKIRNNI
ncbi:MAG: MarR family transcriptional regulator [Spirochaetes bacterium]|nr:MAG: MarR family transcriptional regulator [Spirochaetota bacterium]